MMSKINDDMSVLEVSELLGVTPRSVINYVKSKEIEGIKVGKSWFNTFNLFRFYIDTLLVSYN